MGFIPITIEDYIRKHLENIPSDNEKEIRERIENALKSYQKGQKCFCGNDIWVIGSAAVGNTCFSCITGEDYPFDDYEIECAVFKKEYRNGNKDFLDLD